MKAKENGLLGRGVGLTCMNNELVISEMQGARMCIVNLEELREERVSR